jgi:hypothetical protein
LLAGSVTSEPPPDNRSDLTTRLYEHIRANPQMAKVYEDEYFFDQILYEGLGTSDV